MNALRRLVIAALLGSVGCERSPERAPAAAPERSSEHAPAATDKPATSTQPDARYVVFKRGAQIMALVPGGVGPFALELDLPPRYPVHGNGKCGAENTPLMSPDGRHLAHVLGDRLLVTDIPTRTTQDIAGLDGPMLVGCWSPDGQALFAIEDAGGLQARVYIVALEDMRATLLPDQGELNGAGVNAALTLYWGQDHRELVKRQPTGAGVAIMRLPLPDLDPPSPILELPRGPGYQLADIRARRVVGRSGYAKSKIWVWGPEGDLGTRRAVLDVPKAFMGDVRLSPDGQYLALCLDAGRDQIEPAEFVVVDIASETVHRFGGCRSSWRFFWYDDTHLVLSDHDEILYIGLDAEPEVLVSGATLIEQRRRGAIQ